MNGKQKAAVAAEADRRLVVSSDRLYQARVLLYGAMAELEGVKGISRKRAELLKLFKAAGRQFAELHARARWQKNTLLPYSADAFVARVRKLERAEKRFAKREGRTP